MHGKERGRNVRAPPPHSHEMDIGKRFLPIFFVKKLSEKVGG